VARFAVGYLFLSGLEALGRQLDRAGGNWFSRCD
jgi:hypothetical protein